MMQDFVNLLTQIIIDSILIYEDLIFKNTNY